MSFISECNIPTYTYSRINICYRKHFKLQCNAHTIKLGICYSSYGTLSNSFCTLPDNSTFASNTKMSRHLRFVARTVMVQEGNVDAAYKALNRWDAFVEIFGGTQINYIAVTLTINITSQFSRCANVSIS